MIVNIDKGLLKAIKWLQKAASKDPARPILQATNCNGHIEACDGFRVHAVKTELYEYDAEKGPTDNLLNGLYHIDNPKVGFNVVASNDSEYPNLGELIPRKPPVFQIFVNPKPLADALVGQDGYVRLSFYSATEAFEVQGFVNECDSYALIMPCHDDDRPRWKPYQTQEGA